MLQGRPTQPENPPASTRRVSTLLDVVPVVRHWHCSAVAVMQLGGPSSSSPPAPHSSALRLLPFSPVHCHRYHSYPHALTTLFPYPSHSTFGSTSSFILRSRSSFTLRFYELSGDTLATGNVSECLVIVAPRSATVILKHNHVQFRSDLFSFHRFRQCSYSFRCSQPARSCTPNCKSRGPAPVPRQFDSLHPGFAHYMHSFCQTLI